MNGVTIEKVTPDNWEEYKKLRLEMLREVPQAFEDTYEEAIKRTPHQWKEKVATDTRVVLVAKVNGLLAGSIGILYKEGIRTSHIAHIWGVYVAEEYRGMGLGTTLLQAAEQEIRLHAHIKKIKLEVVETQDAAKHLYKKMGFEETGVHRKEMKVGDRYYDEYLLEKLL